MQGTLLKSAAVLGLLSVVGPLAVDMYLPALPTIGTDLGADVPQVQLSLMGYLCAVAICQLIYGPASDMFGRKAPFYFGLTVYIIGALGAAWAPTIEWLIGFRILQGVGACASMSLPRAIVRDSHTGLEAAKLMSLVMLVFSISPILAPLIGSLVMQFGDWRTTFVILSIVGGLALLLVAFQLPETRPRSARLQSSLGSAAGAYLRLLKDGRFMGLSLIGSLGIASFMAFLGNSSFVYIEHYGLSPTLYSVAFSVNAVSFFAVSQSTGYFVGRFGLQAVVRAAVTGYAVSLIALLMIFLAGVDSIWAIVVLMFIGFGFLGLVAPTTGVLAMEEHGDIAGSASALMGTIQQLLAVVVIGVVGAFADGTALPMLVGFAVCASAALVITFVTLRPDGRSDAVPQPAA